MQSLAYAKINLTLDIAGKKTDGYHLLRMVMQSVSLCDRLTLTQGAPGIRLRCGRADVPCDESNTVYKAAAAFFAYSGKLSCIDITIEKNIPSQAGLGGGSADAAAALHALNALYHTGYSVETLCKIGLQAGADVPFCVLGGTALAEGIGERLTALPPLPHCFLVICKPPVGVNTKRAYALADSLRVAGMNTEPMLEAIRSGSLSAAASALGNDFERVVRLKDVESIKQVLCLAGALGACMTGSGSAVYGIFEEKSAAAACKAELAEEYAEVFLCEPVNTPFAIL
jgi:4-diphosphocytidyl-2C-methyl-D-erythritol kinase